MQYVAFWKLYEARWTVSPKEKGYLNEGSFKKQSACEILNGHFSSPAGVEVDKSIAWASFLFTFFFLLCRNVARSWVEIDIIDQTIAAKPSIQKFLKRLLMSDFKLWYIEYMGGARMK